MPTYYIRRSFFNDDEPTQTIATGLTLEEAQAHCQDPETSSSTCSDEMRAAIGASGPWFDVYEEE